MVRTAYTYTTSTGTKLTVYKQLHGYTVAAVGYTVASYTHATTHLAAAQCWCHAHGQPVRISRNNY